MNWLSQNWFWVLLAIGVAVYFSRGGLGRHGGGPGGLLGGSVGHGRGRGHDSGHGQHRDEEPHDSRAPGDAPEAVVDPVSGEALRTDQALTSLYAGKVYYFASRENRDRFEAMPQDYAGTPRVTRSPPPPPRTSAAPGAAAAERGRGASTRVPRDGAKRRRRGETGAHAETEQRRTSVSEL